MKFSEIKPLGNFKVILEMIRKKADTVISDCNKEKKYNSKLASLIKNIHSLGIFEALKDGISKNEGWNIEEMKICLLYYYLIIIDLNDTAQLYLNKIEMRPRMEQLQDYINDNKKVFGKIKLEIE